MSDANEGKRRINWLAVRTYYMSGHTQKECSDRFNVSTRSIERKATEEGWVDQRRANVGKADKELRKTDVTDTASVMLSHIEYADRLMKIAMQGEEDLAAIAPGRSRIEARKAMLEAADKAVRIAREVRGFRSGDASEQDENNDAPSISVQGIRKDVVQRPVGYQEQSA